MICFKSKKPPLRIGDYLVSEYNADWLAEAFDTAAARLDMDLPFRDDLITAVWTYLEETCPWRVLSLDELYRKIRAMLSEVGLSALASQLPELSPPVQVAIDEIAKINPLLLFFASNLNRKVASLRSMGVTDYLFSGEKECVYELQGKKIWNKNSDFLLEEIHFLLSKYKSQDIVHQ